MKITLNDGREYELPFEPGEKVLVIEHTHGYSERTMLKETTYTLVERTLDNVDISVGRRGSLYDPIEPQWYYYKKGEGEQLFAVEDEGCLFKLTDREQAEEVVKLKNQN